jgi:hypothetical protein
MHMQSYSVKFTVTQSGSMMIVAKGFSEASKIAEQMLIARGANSSDIISESVKISDVTKEV